MAAVDLHRVGAEPDPYRRYEELRENGPVVWDPVHDEWVVLGHSLARRVLADPATFDSRAVAARIVGDAAAHDGVSSVVPIIGLDGPDHARLRRIVSRAFTPRRVGELRGFVEAALDPMLTRLLDAGGGDIQRDVFDRLPAMVIAQLIGVGEGDHDSLVRWARAMVLGVFGDPTEADQREIDAALVEMTAWMDRNLVDRELRGASDVFSLLTRAEYGDEHLTEVELRVFLFTLLVAGSFTTSYLLGNGLLVLAAHADQLAGLRACPDSTAAFVEEVLRYDSPAQVVQRSAVNDTELAGVPIAADATVSVIVGAANRDPDAFADPHRFDPDRDGPPHLGFGHGPHFCLGAGLARLEAEVTFRELAARIGTIDLVGPVTRSPTPMFRGPTSLPVAVSGQATTPLQPSVRRARGGT
ncbi:MAG: cytochrome P450 [Actinomycetota bacterium]